MIEQEKTITRRFTIDGDEDNHISKCSGYIESNGDLTKHDVYVYGMEIDGEEYEDYDCDDDDGYHYLFSFNNAKGGDITLKDIIRNIKDIIR